MFVAVQHQIRDPHKWEQAAQHIMTSIEQGKLPKGLNALMYLPGMDGHKAVCLWQGESLEKVKSFLERETGHAAKNEYFQVNEEAAVGMPGAEQLHAEQDKRTEDAMHLAV
jgi:hypothetical protein